MSDGQKTAWTQSSAYFTVYRGGLMVLLQTQMKSGSTLFIKVKKVFTQIKKNTIFFEIIT